MGHEGGDQHGVPKLRHHGHNGVGGPDAEPQHHVGDGHLQTAAGCQGQHSALCSIMLGATLEWLIIR